MKILLIILGKIRKMEVREGKKDSRRGKIRIECRIKY